MIRLEQKVIPFEKAKDPHLEARKDKKLRAIKAAFIAARKKASGGAKTPRGKKPAKGGRSSKKK